MPTPVCAPVSRSLRALVVLMGLGWSGVGWGTCTGDSDCDTDQQCCICYKDSDVDGYGDTDNSISTCASQSSDCPAPCGAEANKKGIDENNWILASSDCDDGDPRKNNDSTWWLDCDGDGFGAGATSAQCKQPNLDATLCGAPLASWVLSSWKTSAGAAREYSSEDCADSMSDVYPGNVPSSEVVDEWDNDCDGDCLCYKDGDKDGDGTSSGTTKLIAADGGACPCDTTLSASFTAGDCDDSNPAVKSTQDETCESSGPQVDSDCDGDVNTTTNDEGSIEYIPTGDGKLRGFYDGDADGYGSDGVSPFDVCATPAKGSGASTRAGDCNDYNPDVFPGASESCNENDDNCNGLVDEPLPSGRDWIGPTQCIPYYRDGDGDGQGLEDRRVDSDADKVKGICLCSTDLTPPQNDKKSFTFDFDFCPPSAVCEESTVEAISQMAEVYGASGSMIADLADNDTDCDDADDTIYNSSDRPEVNDGRDSNCTRSLSLAELDCDGDGYFVGQDGAASADSVALTCDGSADVWPGGGLDCDGDVRLAPVCRLSGETYIWTVSTVLDAHEPLFPLDEYGQRTSRASTPENGEDCDDLRGQRNPGTTEECDGLDNNCSSSVDCDEMDAFTGACEGMICDEESDPDCDGYITCTLGEPVNEQECSDTEVLEPRGTCDTVVDQLGSGDTWGYCARSFPLLAAEEDLTCDGILPPKRTHVHPDEADEDGDKHLACGPTWAESPSDVGEESVFLLAFFPTESLSPKCSEDSYYSDPDKAPTDYALPLLLPRAVKTTVALDEMGEEETVRTIVESDLTLHRTQTALYEDPYAPDRLRTGWLQSVQNGRTFRQQANSYPTVDPLLDLCIRAELCLTEASQDTSSPAEPSWCAHTPRGRCAVLELNMSNAGFQFIKEEFTSDSERRDTSAPDTGDTTALDTVDALGLAVGPVAGEESVRLVWSGERILESRRRVIEWDCFITFGTYGCGHLEPSVGQAELDSFKTTIGAIYGASRARDEVTEDALYCLEKDPTWAKEIGRFRSSDTSEEAEVLSRYDDNLLSCWGDPTVDPDLGNSISPRVGGDCADGAEGAHRDGLEGPYDLRSNFIDQIASCEETCLDGLDNNCDGLTDCEDPGCAPCFIGQGTGCAGAAEGSPCASSGGCSAGRGARAPGLAALITLLLGALTLPLRRRSTQ